jgi:putative sigma-54 modulation protein
MQLIVKGKNLELTDWMKSYVEKKLGKLDRYLDTIDETRVELSYEATKSTEHRQIAQVTVRTGGKIIRAEERAGDIRDAIDTVVDKTYQQIVRYKGKAWFNNRTQMQQQETSEEEELLLSELLVEVEEEEEEEMEPAIVRRKRFSLNPMNEAEAIEQMELLGHDFFLFYNVDAGMVNVVYRRRDGNYGILEPMLA